MLVMPIAAYTLAGQGAQVSRCPDFGTGKTLAKLLGQSNDRLGRGLLLLLYPALTLAIDRISSRI